MQGSDADTHTQTWTAQPSAAVAAVRLHNGPPTCAHLVANDAQSRRPRPQHVQPLLSGDPPVENSFLRRCHECVRRGMWCLRGRRVRCSRLRNSPAGTLSLFGLQVVLAAVCRTVLYNAPLIFLREAENAQGQNDVVVAANPFELDFALNYTAVNSLAVAAGSQVCVVTTAAGAAISLAPTDPFAMLCSILTHSSRSRHPGTASMAQSWL